MKFAFAFFADMVVLLHLGFVLFVMLGGLLVLKWSIGINPNFGGARVPSFMFLAVNLREAVEEKGHLSDTSLERPEILNLRIKRFRSGIGPPAIKVVQDGGLMEFDRLHRRLEGRQDLTGGFEFGVPLLQLLVSVAFRLTVFVDASIHHGAGVGFLQHVILAEENGAPFLL